MKNLIQSLLAEKSYNNPCCITKQGLELHVKPWRGDKGH